MKRYELPKLSRIPKYGSFIKSCFWIEWMNEWLNYILEHIQLNQLNHILQHPKNKTLNYDEVETLYEVYFTKLRQILIDNIPFLCISPRTRVISKRVAVPLVGSMAPKLQASLNYKRTRIYIKMKM